MKKRAVIAACAVAALIVLILFMKPESVGEHYEGSAFSGAADGTVTLEVSCAEIANSPEAGASLKENGLVPDDGILVYETGFPIIGGDTAFSVLSRALKERRIHFDYSAVGDHSVYVKGINNIYEYDCGDLSGWMYSVNGDFPTVSASEYTLSDGDSVRWIYTCDLGRDVGDTYYALQGGGTDE